jgi:hypothetical protein
LPAASNSPHGGRPIDYPGMLRRGLHRGERLAPESDLLVVLGLRRHVLREVLA